ncbi:MAG: hypothetical protein MUE73_11030 [Planctomycetes bacterium]|jgi:hypothetical protein|nr:hypothetical protein [Planctomycetota bacterium]
MSDPDAPPRPARGRRLLVAVLAAAVVLPLAATVLAHAFSTPEIPFLERPEGRCLEGTPFVLENAAWMRFHHWEFLRWLREEAVRYGRRGVLTLNKCRECHPSRAAFCDRCHDSTSLTPDCFGCHYYP